MKAELVGGEDLEDKVNKDLQLTWSGEDCNYINMIYIIRIVI